MIIFIIPEEEKRQFKEYCENNGFVMSKILRRMIKLFLTDEEFRISLVRQKK
jgi:hypothetical protein